MNATHLLKPHLVIISLGLLVSCTSQVSLPEQQQVTSESATAKRSPSQVTSWNLSGGIAAKSHQRGWSATLNWLQKGPDFSQLRLMGPLGGGSVIIEKQGQLVTYKDGAKQIKSKDGAALLKKETGINLPLNSLYYWVRGLPSKDTQHTSRYDNNHHIIQLSQSGYTISYSDYKTIQGVDLPTKIRLSGNGASIKLVIRNWGI